MDGKLLGCLPLCQLKRVEEKVHGFSNLAAAERAKKSERATFSAKVMIDVLLSFPLFCVTVTQFRSAVALCTNRRMLIHICFCFSLGHS